MIADRQTSAQPPTDRLCLSVAECADAIRVSPRQIYNLARDAGLPTILLGGRRLIRVDDLRRWVAEQPVAMFEGKEGEPPGPARPAGPDGAEGARA